MYLSIIILPLLGSIFSGFLGRKLGQTGANFITIFSLSGSAILSTFVFYEVCLLESPVYIQLNNWINSEFLSVSWYFLFDQLSCFMIIMITYITTLILIYTTYYMAGDPHVQRFMSYLSAFAGFMLILVTGGNYFVMFLGWEGIGIVSYLLISYFFTRIQATKAALLALTMNRVGDMGMSIGFFAMFILFGSLDYSTIFSLAPYMNENAITIIALLLFSGAMAKSAQVPLHSWLPGSMEAPTPVSALLHAATLVTAGVYLLIRSSPILEYSSNALLVITLVGALTAFIGASSGLVQNDIKRIIAFSTISQLGYMIVCVGISQYNIALLHTILHAFFKALLFLAAGQIIHSLYDQQDIRKMGGLIKFLPYTYSVLLIGSLSLAALPFLSGFYSKDLIIELTFGQYKLPGIISYILLSLGAGFTAYYSFRLISLVFLSLPNANKMSYLNVHDANLPVIFSLTILGIFSIFCGYILSDMFGLGSNFLGNSILIHPSNMLISEAEFSLPLYIKLLPLILTVIGSILALYIYNFNSTILIVFINNNLGKLFNNLLSNKYYFDLLYNYYIINKALQIGYNISKMLDKGIIELLGPYGLSNILINTSMKLTKLDTGIITTYALYITISLISILFILFSPNLVQFSLLEILENEIRIIIIYLFSLTLISWNFK